ncbi:MAG: hypothetical protein JNM81_01355 [Rhodospirillaceae bacterium]|nr:hypothetical protein [Rhodospirillaceae bacterium]
MRFLPLFAVLLFSAAPVSAADSINTWLGKSDFKMYRVFTGPEGRSVVEEITVPVGEAGPAGKFGIIDRDVKNMNIGYYENGWFSDWHPPNSKRLNLVLQGDFIFDIGDGKEYRIKAGEMILAEDFDGKGHTSRCDAANNQRCISMSVVLEPKDDKPTKLRTR